MARNRFEGRFTRRQALRAAGTALMGSAALLAVGASEEIPEVPGVPTETTGTPVQDHSGASWTVVSGPPYTVEVRQYVSLSHLESAKLWPTPHA